MKIVKIACVGSLVALAGAWCVSAVLVEASAHGAAPAVRR